MNKTDIQVITISLYIRFFIKKMRSGLLSYEKEAREPITQLRGNKLAIMLYKIVGGEMTTKIDSQLLKGVLTGYILQLLLKEELYGYTLSERLADNGFSDISNGTIYPLLLSMEKKRLDYWSDARI